MGRLVRLACLRHAASVHPEPGSNSQNKKNNFKNLNFLATNKLTFCSVFKDHFAFHFLKRIDNITNNFFKVNNFFNFFLNYLLVDTPKEAQRK